jgi:adenylate cyclase
VTIRVRLPGGEIACQPGERLLDAVDASGATVLNLGCRDASCGTCAVAVASGGGALAPPEVDERRLLTRLQAAADLRLGCQLRIADDAPDNARIELSPRAVR